MNKSTRNLVCVVVALVVLLFLLPVLLQKARINTALPTQERSVLPRAPVTPAAQAQMQSPPGTVQPSAPPAPPPAFAIPKNSSGVIENAYQNQASNLPVMETGVVSRILSDDNDGARHQRFILSLASGHTILIAHNIDIAPRINNLREGDQVTFSGLYEWNEKGGVVHWTHHDPSGRYGGGYLQHNGMYFR